MYVPPYGALLNRFGARNDPEAHITIPLPLFQLLLQFALATAHFDEDAYLTENPDVAGAVRQGLLESGYAHYMGYGYFENRRGAFRIDETWYEATYDDVRAAIRAQELSSATEHFLSTGGAEGRSPNPDEVETAERWRIALQI